MNQRGFIQFAPFLAFLKPVWAFLSAIPWWVWVVIGFSVLHFVDKGHAVREARKAERFAVNLEWAEKWDAAEKRWEAKLEAYQAEAKAANQELFDRLVVAQSKVRVEVQTVIDKVTEYVPIVSDAACSINLGFLRGYAKAARGEDAVAGLPGGPNEAATGTTLSTVLATDAANLGDCRNALKEAAAWREWWVKNKKVCEDKGICEKAEE